MSLDGITVNVEGLPDLVQTIDRLIEGFPPAKVEPELHKGAKIMAAELKKTAPVGPSGNLKKAIVTRKLEARWKNPAPYIAAIDRKKAPHGWLVVHGTSGVRKVSPPRMVVIDGRPAVIDNTGIMPPNRFFDKAVEAQTTEVLFRLEVALGKLVEEAIR